MPLSLHPLRKPPPLQIGDTVGIVAPASPIKRELLEAGCDQLRRMGYKPFYFDNIFDHDIYFAGPPDQRAHDIEEMFERDDVHAVICARGGYGSNYLLPHLNLDRLRRYPKIFVGYSDMTCLLTRMVEAGIVCFHGPMVTKDFARPDGVHLAAWQAAVSGREQWTLDGKAVVGFRPLIRGAADGILYGGCLSILAASVGTPFEIHTEGKILFMEDVGTKPYQVDRMLMQLKYAGKLDKVAGFIFGEMIDCEQPGEQEYRLEEVVRRILRELRVPVAFGLPSGHVPYGNMTLPFGVQVRLEVDYEEGASLTFLESATAPVAQAQQVQQNLSSNG